jgi:hypothetical protein
VAPETYLSLFSGAARQAEQAEAAFRRGYAAELQRLERERAFAHRRFGLMQAIGRSLEEITESAEGRATVHRVLAREFGLDAAREAHRPILEAFDTVSDAILASMKTGDTADGTLIDPAAVPIALAAFEAWYLSRTGTPFMALYDVYVPETPVVDW